MFIKTGKVVQCMRQKGITDRSIVAVFAPIISKIFQAFPHLLGIINLQMFFDLLGVCGFGSLYYCSQVDP